MSKPTPLKSVLVLGGTSDIGAAVAKKFAHEKFVILLAGRNEEYLKKIAADIAIRENADVTAFNFDALDFSSHKDFYRSLPLQPDVCVCVFGYLGDNGLGMNDWPEAERIIDTNYKGAISILNVVANDFVSLKRGTIVGISSVAGDRGRQSNFLYGSAKAGFSTYLSGLRNKLFGSKVHVVTVKPGFVHTRMTEDLDLPVWLATDPHHVASVIYKAYVNKTNTVYVLHFWKYIMMIIKSIPEFIFKRMKL
ncbi:MAG TPA: SDR family oxidoreductase [Cyclobacteriaceae bacterium]|nr:SDR family oxidoreductase [Cyclobacteriaceae bacterium]